MFRPRDKAARYVEEIPDRYHTPRVSVRDLAHRSRNSCKYRPLLHPTTKKIIETPCAIVPSVLALPRLSEELCVLTNPCRHDVLFGNEWQKIVADKQPLDRCIDNLGIESDSQPRVVRDLDGGHRHSDSANARERFGES